MPPALEEARDILMNRLTREFTGTIRVDVASTATRRSRTQLRPGIPSKEFKPRLFTGHARSYVVPFAVAILLFAIIPTSQVIYWLVIVGVLMLVTSLISDNRDGHRIHLDQRGITIGGATYVWDALSDTVILTGIVNPGARNAHVFENLVLVFKQGGYRLLDLERYTAFGGIAPELSRYIEYFKPSASGG